MLNYLLKFRFAFDLYKNQRLSDISLSFTNPFAHTTLIQYNPQNKELFTWDQGNLLTYPIRYSDMDKNNTKEESDEMKNGTTGISKITD